MFRTGISVWPCSLSSLTCWDIDRIYLTKGITVRGTGSGCCAHSDFVKVCKVQDTIFWFPSWKHVHHLSNIYRLALHSTYYWDVKDGYFATFGPKLHLNYYLLMALDSLGNNLFCSLDTPSHSDKIPAGLVFFRPITIIYLIWGRFNTSTICIHSLHTLWANVVSMGSLKFSVALWSGLSN